MILNLFVICYLELGFFIVYMLSPLEKSILGALVYFDIFAHPLTLLEIQRYLLNLGASAEDKQYTLDEIKAALDASPALERAVRFKNGFYYLRGREANLRTRAERYGYAAPKYRRARKVARLLSYLPFVRLIAVCNSLSISAAGKESDIDLFIVVRAGGVWWARLFALGLLKFLRLRPGQSGRRNKICLSFFVDENHLSIPSERPAGKFDVHQPYWYAALYPLYDAGNWYSRLWQANAWLKLFLPEVRPVVAPPARVFRRRPAFRLIIEFCLAPFTSLAAAWQRRLFPAAIKKILNQDNRIRVEPGVLKFHTNGRRAEYNREFFNRFNAISSRLL